METATTQDLLNNFVKTNSVYVNWPDDNGRTWEFVKAEQVTNAFGAEVVEYVLKDEEGNVRSFSSGSVALAREMLKVVGKKIKITKTGEKSATKYEVVEVK